MNILAIDPSSTVAGFVLFQHDPVEARTLPVRAGVWDMTKCPSWEKYPKLIEFIQLTHEGKPLTQIACERAFMGRFNTAALAVAVHCIEEWARINRVPFTLYSPPQWKKGVIGKGTADKDTIREVLTRGNAWLADVLPSFRDNAQEHVVDAYGVGLHHIRQLKSPGGEHG